MATKKKPKTKAKKKKPQGITEKQKKFVEEWLQDHNATQAAIRAGYSEKTAYSQGQRLLKKVEVQEYREKLLNDIKKPTIATIEEVLEYYTRVMRREEKESIVVTVKEKQSGWATNKETGKREKVTIEKETPQIVEIPTKVSDANKAAEMLGKNYGIWTERMNIDSNQSITFVEDLEPDEEELTADE